MLTSRPRIDCHRGATWCSSAASAVGKSGASRSARQSGSNARSSTAVAATKRSCSCFGSTPKTSLAASAVKHAIPPRTPRGAHVVVGLLWLPDSMTQASNAFHAHGPGPSTLPTAPSGYHDRQNKGEAGKCDSLCASSWPSPRMSRQTRAANAPCNERGTVSKRALAPLTRGARAQRFGQSIDDASACIRADSSSCHDACQRTGAPRSGNIAATIREHTRRRPRQADALVG